MSHTHPNLEQLLAEKNELESQIKDYKFRKQIIFETKGLKLY